MAAYLRRLSYVAVAVEASTASSQADVLSLVQTVAVKFDRSGRSNPKEHFAEAMAQAREDERLMDPIEGDSEKEVADVAQEEINGLRDPASVDATEDVKAVALHADENKHVMGLASDVAVGVGEEAIAKVDANELRGLASETVKERFEAAAEEGETKKKRGQDYSKHAKVDANEFGGLASYTVQQRFKAAAEKAETRKKRGEDYSNHKKLKASVKTAATSKSKGHNVKNVGNETAELTDVPTLLRASDRVSANISSMMSELEAGLAEAHVQSIYEVSSQRAEYEAKLREQQAESHTTELKNADLAVKIHGLRKANARRRIDAESLANETNILKSDIQGLREDVTSAADLINASLQFSELNFHNAKELAVLSTLADQDDSLTHQKLLDAIGGVHMLQGKPKTTKQQQPEDLLHSLMSSLGDFSKEQNESTTLLKQSFEHKLQVGADKQKLLLEKSDKLKEMWESEEELHEKLDIAIQHLQKARKQLSEQKVAIRKFVAHGKLSGE